MRTNDANGPGIVIAGLVNFDRPYDGNGHRAETQRQVSYTIARSVRHQLWKADATVNRVHLDGSMADGSVTRIYSRAWPILLRAARFPPTGFRFNTDRLPGDQRGRVPAGSLVGDATPDGRPETASRLRTFAPTVPTGHQECQPLAGLAYQAAPGWILCAGYGIFFDRYVLANLTRALQKNGINAFEQVLEGSAAASFPGRQRRAADRADCGLSPSIHRPDTGLATLYSQQTSFSVEQQIARDLTHRERFLPLRARRKTSPHPQRPSVAGRAGVQSRAGR